MGRPHYIASIATPARAAAFAALLLVAACGGGGDEDPTTTTTTSSTTTSTTAASTTSTTQGDPYGALPEPGDEEPLSDGRYAVHVTAIDVEGGRLDVDVVRFFVGAEAESEARKDGVEATDFYVRNAVESIDIVPIGDDVEVLLVAPDDPEPKPATLAEVTPGERLYFVDLAGGKVTTITEQYLP